MKIGDVVRVGEREIPMSNLTPKEPPEPAPSSPPPAREPQPREPQRVR
jgi:hypothetical protein